MKNLMLVTLLIGVFFPFESDATPGIDDLIIKDLRKAEIVTVEPLPEKQCEPIQITESKQKKPVQKFLKRLMNK